MKIYLIRHGESTSDLEDRYEWIYNAHLTDKGMIQAKELADKLKDAWIQILYTSPLLRARDTATVVADALWISAQTRDDLHERNFYGILSGMRRQEVKEHYPELVSELNYFTSNIVGSETYSNFIERIHHTFETLKTQPYQTLGILTHGWRIRCFVRELLKKGELNSVGDCGYFVLDTENIQILQAVGIEFGE